jgi:hypothetical protein
MLTKFYTLLIKLVASSHSWQQVMFPTISQPFTMKESSQSIYWEELICGCSTEGCSAKAFWIDVSMMLKEMN